MRLKRGANIRSAGSTVRERRRFFSEKDRSEFRSDFRIELSRRRERVTAACLDSIRAQRSRWTMKWNDHADRVVLSFRDYREKITGRSGISEHSVLSTPLPRLSTTRATKTGHVERDRGAYVVGTRRNDSRVR